MFQMGIRPIGALLLGGGLTMSVCLAAETLPKLDAILLRENLFETKMVDLPKELQTQHVGGFSWLSEATKDGLRASPHRVSLLGDTVGETIFRGQSGGNLTSVLVQIYARGDDGDLSGENLTVKALIWKKKLDDALKVDGQERKDRSVVRLNGWMWVKGKTAYLLEYSTSRVGSGKEQAEFMRLRMAPMNSGGNDQTVRRDSLVNNVEKKENGDVYIRDVPMVDQGQKGYCAVATAERVVRYFGREVDQNEMAQLAGTATNGGTSLTEMQDALKGVTAKFKIRNTKIFEMDYRQAESDLRDYNRAAKRANVPEVDSQNAYHLISKVDPKVFVAMKEKQTEFGRFERRIQEAIDKGFPICWSLTLGLFPEPGIPQAGGGHMRLIIGYNLKTHEILFTDSWGAGHELKRMPANYAYAMSNCLLVMMPTS